MFKLIFTTLFILLFVTPTFAKRFTPEQITRRYHIVEGNYKLVSGSPADCIAGEYRLKKGTDGIVSLAAAGSLFARKIHMDMFSSKEHGCTTNFTTLPTLNGFKNIEDFHCPQNKTTYSRELTVQFSNKQLTYTMKTKRVLEGKQDKISCVLQLVEGSN